MKKIIILLSILFSILALCQYTQNDYHFDSNRIILDKELSNKKVFPIIKKDAYSNLGIYMNYKEENGLYCTSNILIEYGSEADLSKIATNRWKRMKCYDKKGLMVLKFERFLRYDQVEKLYYRDKNNKIKESGNIGDSLFSSTLEEIIRVLESININPVSIYEKNRYSEMNANLIKIFTAGGQFWEFRMRSENIAVLIDDKTREIIAKTYDTNPKVISTTLISEYNYRRNKAIYPETIKPKYTAEQIWEITKKNYPDAGKGPIELVTKKIWRVKTGSNENPILCFISDETGEIILDSEKFSKNYLGEQDFIKAANLMLKNN